MPADYQPQYVQITVNHTKAILQRFIAIPSAFLRPGRCRYYAGRPSAIDEVIP